MRRRKQPEWALAAMHRNGPDDWHYPIDLADTAKVGPGSMYLGLSVLERAGRVVASWDAERTADGFRCRRYRMTDLGRHESRALDVDEVLTPSRWRAALWDLVERLDEAASGRAAHRR